MMASLLKTLILHVLACSYVVSGAGFLKQDPKATRRGAVDHDLAFQQAMASVMGCAASSESNSEQHLGLIERSLSPLWRVLPKNEKGRVEWKLLRYLTHRFFLQQYSLLIRGLEPVRQVNDSDTGAAVILSKRAPSLIETILEGKRSSGGFSLEDAVALVGTMEQLIFDSESVLLEKVYKIYEMPVQQRITKQHLLHLMEGYMLLWMLGDDDEITFALLANRTAIEDEIPHWHSIKQLIDGLITGLQYSRQQNPRSGSGQLLMSHAYAFEDVHQIAGALTKTFASYWESECQSMKSLLEAMDYTGTGRVKLSAFYGANADGEWHFGESEAYLRELGALDEFSTWNEKQVIIPNYLQGASNCIVTSEHYFVCCVNECEGVLIEIEGAVASPLAVPEEIFQYLLNITTFDDESPKLTAMLKKQLEKIAEPHAGKVPLHGRLFAQWLHYVFPRECPFPHKIGSVNALAPKEYGDSFIATNEEVRTHAATRNRTTTETSVLEDAQLMSWWSEEEELIGDYSLHIRAPWQNNQFVSVGLVASSLLALWLKVASTSRHDKPKDRTFHSQPKAHLV